MAILTASHLKKYYGSGDTLVKALDGVNLSVEDGEFVQPVKKAMIAGNVFEILQQVDGIRLVHTHSSQR